MKKAFYLILGFVGLGLGAVGAILPLIPAFPFLLLALYGFTRSSRKVHDWFVGTTLYKDNLASYVQGQGMSKKVKIKIMTMVTLLMAIGFVMMHKVFVGQMVLMIVWIFHVLYFAFGVKTYPEE